MTLARRGPSLLPQAGLVACGVLLVLILFSLCVVAAGLPLSLKTPPPAA